MTDKEVLNTNPGREIISSEVSNSEMIEKNTKLAMILVFLVTIMRGSQYIMTKQGLDDIPPFLFQGIRHVIALLGFLPFWNKFKSLDKKTIKASFLISTVLAILYGFLTIGLNNTTSSKGAFLATLYVIFTPFVAFFVLKRKPTNPQLIAVIIAVIGMSILIFGNSNSSDAELAPNIGDFLVIGAAFCNGIQIVLIEKYVEDVDLILFVMSQMLFIAIYMFIGAGLFGERVKLESIPSKTWGVLVYMGIMVTTVAIGVQTWAQKYLDSTRAALLYSLEPVWALFFGISLGGELLTIYFGIGAALILIANVYSSKYGSQIVKNQPIE